VIKPPHSRGVEEAYAAAATRSAAIPSQRGRYDGYPYAERGVNPVSRLSDLIFGGAPPPVLADERCFESFGGCEFNGGWRRLDPMLSPTGS
jgi:hypothetical protein